MNICKENQHFFHTPPNFYCVCKGSKNFFLYPPKFLVCVWGVGGGLKTETGKFHERLTSVWGGLKTFLYPPQNFGVWGGEGLKTETGKFHEILTVFFLLLHEHLQRKSTFFYTPPNF